MQSGLTGISLRPARATDLPRLHAVRAAAFAPVFAGFRAAVGPDIAPTAFGTIETEQAAHLDHLLKAHSVVVAWEGDVIVGFCAWCCDTDSGLGELELNAVHPRWQRRGIGGAMYAHVLEAMRAAGMKAVTVGTGGDAAHAGARRAYAKAGFLARIPNLHLYRSL